MQEPPGLKQDWFDEINSFSMKYSYNLLYNKRSTILPQIGSKDTGDNFWKSVCHFFYGQEQHWLYLPLSFNMRMLNMSWPWALLGSSFLINVAISSLVKVTVEIDLSVFLQILEGSSLELFIIEHCLAKKQLNNSAFFLKSVTYLFWWKRGGIQGILLLFKNNFNIDQ